MPVTDADLNVIFLYLDNELPEDEEQQLIQRMQENPELQQAFDQQVLMSAYLAAKNETKITGVGFESADDYVNRINRITGDNNAGGTDSGKRVVLPTVKKRWQPLAVAAAIAALVIAATFYILNKKNDGPAPIVKTPDRQIIPKANDSTVILPDSSRVSPDKILPETLYDEYYTLLAENDLKVPVAATPYQTQYRHGHYTELADANENVVATKGQISPTEEQNIINHFNFYKALSNIEIKKYDYAEALLKRLLSKSENSTALNNYVKWYLLLVYLKNNNRPEAAKIAASIATKKISPYRTRAAEIQEKLSH